MKRRDLEAHLRTYAYQVIREGANPRDLVGEPNELWTKLWGCVIPVLAQ